MGRNSDSDLLKNYCENHQGELFDFGYLSSHHFQMIEYNNLRMIVSRLENRESFIKSPKEYLSLEKQVKTLKDAAVDVISLMLLMSFHS